jgi:hypothetical protein
MMRRRLRILVTILCACTIGSCRKGPAPSVSAGSADGPVPVHKVYGTGPVKFVVDLSATSITTADALDCRLTLQIAPDFEAEFPDLRFPDDAPGVVLTDYKEDETKLGTDRVLTREYELEPEYDGTFKLPAMQVYFHKANEIREEMIETAPIEVTVKKTPPSAEALALKPVRGLVTAEEIAAQHRRLWPRVLGAAVLASALVALAVYWLRRPRPIPPPPPAHEIALEALRALIAKDLVGQGRVEQFFVEITSIVRDYIERAFGLRAPEQTTEEFLANITSQPVVARHREALGPFLTAADEVKFACMAPDRMLIQKTFDTARDFVVQTSGAKGGEA